MVRGVSSAGDSPLGVLDYAHLRVPLPKGIVSGIFKSSPSVYFLMRRSSDGHVSATGMFKATFPYAQASEEESERAYIKSLATPSPEETTGNIWIPPDRALILAEEYGITPWINALLDPADIATSSTPHAPPKTIRPPPKFDQHKVEESAAADPPPPPVNAVPATLNGPNLAPLAPSLGARSNLSRRSASPTKATRTPRRRNARNSSRVPSETPTVPAPSGGQSEVKHRKSKRSEKAAQATQEILVAEAASPPSAFPVAKEFNFKAPIHEGEHTSKGSKMTVSVSGETHVGRSMEISHTEEAARMAVGDGPPSADETAKMIAIAKAQVESAAGDGSDATVKVKRKAEEVEADSDEKKVEEGIVEPQTKRTKTDTEIRKDQAKRRTLFGITATIAVGYVSISFPF